jgi:hypothetical protein
MDKKTYAIQSRIDKNQMEKLLDDAREKGISLSLLIRFILINYLEKKNND